MNCKTQHHYFSGKRHREELELEQLQLTHKNLKLDNIRLEAETEKLKLDKEVLVEKLLLGSWQLLGRIFWTKSHSLTFVQEIRFWTTCFWLAVHGKSVLFWKGISGLKLACFLFYAC